jgi:hypothetical protein
MQGIVGDTTEVSRVIAAVSLEYYAASAPTALAGRLARLHQRAWETVMSGASADHAYAELQRYSDKLFNGRELIETGDRHIVWALTPVLAASLACGPGEERISLREVGGALWRLLHVSLKGAEALAAETRHERRAA